MAKSFVKRVFDPEAPASMRIARNVASILLGDAAAEAVNTVTTARSALALGLSSFGELSAAQAFVDPFRSLAAFGLGVVCMTVAARRGGPDGTLSRTLMLTHGLLTLIAVAAVLAISAATGLGGSMNLVSTVALGVYPVVALTAARLPVQYAQAMHRLLVLPVVVAAARLALTEVAIRTSNTPIAHQAAITVSGIGGLIATWLVVQRLYRLEGAWETKLAKELLALAWPIAVLDITVTIYLKAAYLLLRSSGPAVLGAYAAAERLAQPLLGISAAIVTSSLPLVTQAAVTGDGAALGRVFRRTIARAATVLLPTIALAALIAPWAIARFAPAYLHAVRPFQVLLIGALFMFLNQLSSMFIIGIGRFNALMAVAFVNLGVYLALAWFLVPRYGAVGSAVATTVMEAINCLVQLTVVARLVRTRRP